MNTILEYINVAGQWFVGYSFTILIQSSILIAILLLADFVLRKKVRAVFRYWIWMLVLLKLVLPISLSTPISLGRWFGDELAYMDINQSAEDTEATVNAEATVRAEPIVNTEVTAEAETEFVPAIISTFIDSPLIEVNVDKPTVKPLIPDPRPASAPVTAEIVQDSSSMTLLSWQGVVFIFWLVVITAMSLLLLQRAIFVRGLIRQARPANNLMNEALEYCCKRMGVEREVRLKVSVNATSPAVCGLFRPVILLPRNLGPTLGSSHLRTVMMHELAHIKRGDLWVNMIQTALQIVYFYNPLLWLANAIIRNVREQAVDETVLVAMGPKASHYPETLLSVARLAFARPALSLRLIGVIESKSQLKERIKKMLERPVPKNAKLGIVGILIIIALGAFLLPMAKADGSSSDVFVVSDSAKKQAEAELKMLQEKIAKLEKELKQLQKQIKQKKSQAAEETPVKSKKEKQKIDKQAEQVNELTDKLRMLVQQIAKEKPVETKKKATKKEKIEQKEKVERLEVILKQIKQKKDMPEAKEKALELAKKMTHVERSGKKAQEKAIEIAKKMAHLEKAEREKLKAKARAKEKEARIKEKEARAKEKEARARAKAKAMKAKDQAIAQIAITEKEAKKALEAGDLKGQAKAKVKELLAAIKSLEKQSADADADAHAPAKIVLPKLEKLSKLQKLAKHPKPPTPPAFPKINPHVKIEMPPIPPHPVPKIHPEMMIGDITKSMPKIEPPHETFKQLGQIQAKKAALAKEIDKLRKEIEKKKQSDNISSEDVEALEEKVESLEDKVDGLEDHSDELTDRVEEWSDSVSDRMEEWSDRFNEQMEQKFEKEHEKEFKQYEQQMEQYERQMEQFEKEMGKFAQQHEGQYTEELAQYERQMEQFEKEMEKFEQQHEGKYEKELEEFEHQMEEFEDQIEQWAEQHEHQMEQ
ncbi:MAG: M56 family metallopeptidase, partial [Phycisphaerales bacterium]